jgi:hypothetical protein
MSQSRLHSFVEAWANVLVGFLVGLISNIVVLPMFGYKVTLTDAFGMSVVFTVISIVRSYAIRRWFNSFSRVKK